MASHLLARNSRGVFVIGAALASLLALSSPSRADVVITSSLSAPDGGSAPLFGVGLANAQVFVTDNKRYTLTSLVARVGNQFVDEPGAPFLPFANLRADNGAPSLSTSAPVTGKTNYLTTFAVPNLTGPISDRAFTPNSPVTLEANTRYWFVLGTLSDNRTGFEWAFSSANGPITGPGTVPPHFGLTQDEGDSWGLTNDTPFFIEVRGNVIPTLVAPEPSVLALLAVVGFPAFGLIIRRNAVRK